MKLFNDKIYAITDQYFDPDLYNVIKVYGQCKENTDLKIYAHESDGKEIHRAPLNAWIGLPEHKEMADISNDDRLKKYLNGEQTISELEGKKLGEGVEAVKQDTQSLKPYNDFMKEE